MKRETDVGCVTVLHVEDDNPTAEVFSVCLRKEWPAIEVVRLPDGGDVLSYLEGSCPDLVVLDLNLPTKSGHEILTEVRREPSLGRLPVIIFSSSTDPGDRVRALEAGADGYLVKPESLEGFREVAAQVVEYLRGKKTAFPHGGYETATGVGEARSLATKSDQTAKPCATETRDAECVEKRQLLGAFGEAVRELLQLHKEQLQAIREDDVDCSRFDLLIHMANEKKQFAKYQFLRHMESHGCSNSDDLDES
jgi:DNA-binding response OmpR family regulator